MELNLNAYLQDLINGVASCKVKIVGDAPFLCTENALNNFPISWRKSADPSHLEINLIAPTWESHT